MEKISYEPRVYESVRSYVLTTRSFEQHSAIFSERVK